MMTDDDTVRMNESHSIEDRTGTTPEDENVPPLPSFFTGWKAWLTFAVWPIIFFVVNGLVFGTLIVFDEYDFRRGWRGRTDSYSESSESAYLSMLRFNATVFMIMLFLDATMLYLAARTVEKEVEALDDLNDNADNDRTQATTGALDPLTLSDSRHVHGKISRKLDAILGRGPRPHGSIVVSLLFLACVMSAALGVSSVAGWCFTRTLMAHEVCYSQFPIFPHHDVSDMPIEGIPNKLQKWAKRRGDYSWTRHKIVQLEDKTTFSINRDTTASGRNESIDHMQFEILIAVYSDSTVKLFPNIVQPRLLMRPSETGADDPLNTRGFCSLYHTIDRIRQAGRVVLSTVSLLCVDSSDTAMIKSRGEFRNVTLAEQSDEPRSAELSGYSLNWYADCIWVKYDYYNAAGRHGTTFYNVTVVEGQPLRLVPVSNITERRDASYDMEKEVKSKCARIQKLVFVLALSMSSFAAWAWLKWVQNMAVAIAPISIAAFIAVDLIDYRIALVFSILLSLAAFITLQGYGIPSRITPKREELVWLLYTGLLASAIVGTERIGEFCLFAFLGCCVAGTILGHPALYLAGWMGGIGSVLVGIFFIFINKHVWGMKAISLGIFGGPGCVTVGLFLIKYRSYLSYYAKRAWKSVTQGMRTAGSAHRHLPASS